MNGMVVFERTLASAASQAAMLAVNLLFLIVWGFAGIGKLVSGKPLWFNDKFGGTIFARFPGLDAVFWLLTGSELLAFALALFGLVRGEFLLRKPATILQWMLAWSLFVFVQLSLGQWLTSEFNATAQLFAYFAGTLVCLAYAERCSSTASRGAESTGDTRKDPAPAVR